MSIEINNLSSGRTDGPRKQDGSGKAAPTKSEGTSTAQQEASTADSVSLSSNARDIAQIESEIKGLPEIDQAKVDAIKERIANGEYHIDFAKVAQKMLDIEG